VAEIPNDTMKLSDRRCAAGAASLDLRNKFAVTEVHG
jgi:hypothetical protein